MKCGWAMEAKRRESATRLLPATTTRHCSQCCQVFHTEYVLFASRLSVLRKIPWRLGSGDGCFFPVSRGLGPCSLCLTIAASFPRRIRDTHTLSSVFTSLMVLASMIHQSFLSPLTSYVSTSASSVKFLHMLPLLYYHALSTQYEA